MNLHRFLLLLTASCSLLTGLQAQQGIKNLSLAGTSNYLLSGAVLEAVAGSTLTINGTLSGTPTGGTLNLGNVTVTGLPSSGGTWGGITGTLSNQTDLQAALDAKLTATTLNGYFADPSTNVSFSASAWRSDLGLGTLATQSGTFSGTSSGTNTGDQTITLTGDVTGSGTGSFVATIQANSVALTTDTTGDYVATITGDTEITVSGAGTEGRAVTLAIGSDIARDSEVSGAITAERTATATLSGKTISHAAAPGSDDTFTGDTITGLNNSGGVTQWDVVYLNGSSQWVLADANGTGTYPATGLAVATVSTGEATTVLVRGVVRNDAWTWTPGGRLYLSATAGGLTQTAPATSGDKVQDVGFALSADVAWLVFDGVYVEVD